MKTKPKTLIERLRDLENNMGSAIYQDAQDCGEAADMIETLLMALQYLLEVCHAIDQQGNDAQRQAHAAIAKAIGTA